MIIKLVNAISKIVNADKDMKDVYQVVFLPDYSVSLAELLIPASDVSLHISTAGTEASGTSNMKFCLNGGLILGTVDGANIEIAEEVGDDNVFFFGHTADQIDDLRHSHRFSGIKIPDSFQQAIDAIRQGVFGEASSFQPLIDSVINGGDHYCLTDDFESFLEAEQMIDEAYSDKVRRQRRMAYSHPREGF